MPPERKKPTPHNERKPYVRSYRPFTVRLERPPSRTPSPTGFVSFRRKEYEATSFDQSEDVLPQIGPVSNSHSVVAVPPPTLATPQGGPGGSTETMPTQLSSGPTAASGPEERLQAPPDKAFDPSIRQKIKQPKGGIGKSSSGGYSLSAELEAHGWSGSQYLDVQKEVRALTVLKLDTERSFVNQDPLKVQAFLLEVINRFPGLRYYENEWPARNLAYQYLKNKPKVGTTAQAAG